MGSALCGASPKGSLLHLCETGEISKSAAPPVPLAQVQPEEVHAEPARPGSVRGWPEDKPEPSSCTGPARRTRSGRPEGWRTAGGPLRIGTRSGDPKDTSRAVRNSAPQNQQVLWWNTCLNNLTFWEFHSSLFCNRFYKAKRNRICPPRVSAKTSCVLQSKSNIKTTFSCFPKVQL